MFSPREKDTVVTAPAHARLQPGRVYRTRDLSRWGANASRLAQRLVREGLLVQLAHGIFFHPERSRFGAVPPTDEALMRAYLAGAPFVLTGSERWNALALGSTAVHAATIVYNTKRSGEVVLGGRRFLLRRVRFPRNPPVEWFAIDLLEHAGQAAASRDELASALGGAVRRGALDRKRLVAMADSYGSSATQERVRAALTGAA